MKRWNMRVMAGLWVALMMVTNVHAATVAELVDSMPLKCVQSGTASFDALLTLGADGLAELAGLIQPPDVGGDAKARYLVSGITFYVARPEADAARTLVEHAWLTALDGNEDYHVKAFFMRMLQQCGTPASRDALAAYLADPPLIEPAAQALLAIAAPGTGTCFLDALNAGQGDARTLVQSLGILACADAAEPIRALAVAEDATMQTVALDALAAIGPVNRWIGWNHDSYALLAAACQTTNRYARAQALGRCVRYAEKSVTCGAQKPAALAVQSLLVMSRERGESAVEAAALAILTEIDWDEGLAAVVKSIHGDDRALSIAGVQLMMRLGDDAAAPLAAVVSDAAPHVRVAAMDVLEPGVSDTVVRAVFAAGSDTNSAVQVAALSAAARLADRQSLPLLFRALDSQDAAVLAAVQDALLCVALPEDIAMVVATLFNVPPKARITLLEVLAERRAVSQRAAVVTATTDPDGDVRKAACRALASVGTAAELPMLVAMALSREDAGLSSAAARTVVSVAKAEPDGTKRYAVLLDAYEKGDADARKTLLALLPAIGGKPALERIVTAGEDPDAKVRAAAIRALSGWPDDTAADAMLVALTASHDLAQQVLLVRGLTRVVPGGQRTSDAKLALYRKTLAAAPRADEKNMVLGVVSQIKSRAALDLAAAHLDTPELQVAAARVVALSACPAKKYAGLKDPELRPLLVKAAPLLTDKNLKKAVNALVAKMPVPEVPAPPIADAAFTPLFNGKDLTGWIGDTQGYIVEDGTIICKPGGNLYTAQEYSDFVLRFEFKLTAGANNGLGIRTPAKGNAAYAGMELQILDNTAPKYANLKPWQFHGSIYGLVPAKQGHLKPVGEWNVQEVTADGTRIKVVLNGTIIVDADLATLEQTPDIHPFSKHPGMRNTTGHIGFLGHGSVVEFRNLRIKELGGSAVTPPEGFEALFNGKDLSGWKGLLAGPFDNPVKRATLSQEALAAAQKVADAEMHAHWKVVDGALEFDGKGRSLCTAKDYGDFELLVDWKIKTKGDSGIYLRGSPQVQIWDAKQHKQGSGGLYNNQKHPRHPSVIADRPIEEWNTFRIKMVGEKVTVHLNGQLVTDDVVMENYWDRKQPIFPTGQIELQNHGNTLWFRNVFIREL